jgi:hypothetical protein
VVVIGLLLPRGRLRTAGVAAVVIAAGLLLAWRFAAAPDALAWHRVGIWRALWALVVEAPLTGVGPGWLEEATGAVRIAHEGGIARWGHVIGSAESTPYGLLGAPAWSVSAAAAAAVVWWHACAAPARLRPRRRWSPDRGAACSTAPGHRRRAVVVSGVDQLAARGCAIPAAQPGPAPSCCRDPAARPWPSPPGVRTGPGADCVERTVERGAAERAQRRARFSSRVADRRTAGAAGVVVARGGRGDQLEPAPSRFTREGARVVGARRCARPGRSRLVLAGRARWARGSAGHALEPHLPWYWRVAAFERQLTPGNPPSGRPRARETRLFGWLCGRGWRSSGWAIGS